MTPTPPEQVETTPDAAELVVRFFINHGMIHDRVTGKHVSTEAIEYSEGQFDNSPATETLALLNALTAKLSASEALLRRVEPHLDAIICYASTMGEHEPNRIAFDIRAALARQEPEGASK